MGEGICEDLTAIKEGILSSLLFLLQGQAWLTACSIRKTSFFLPLSPRPVWVQRGRNCKNGSFLQLVGDPRRAGGTPGSSLVPYAHLSCLLCLASWMPGLPRAKWDTSDLHMTPVPFHTSPRLELEAAGRICQPRVIAPTSWSWLVPTIRFSCLVRTELCFPA